MLDHDHGERRYTDEEFVLVLRRAREIIGRAGDEAAPVRPPWADGLTMAEMFEIGREAGIDPTAVAEAAASLGTDQPGVLDGVLGGTLKLLVVSPLDRTLPDDALHRVVDAARAVLGDQGETHEVPGGVAWTSARRQARLYVLAAAEHDGTRIRVEMSRTATVALSYWAPTTLCVGVAGILMGATDYPAGVYALAMLGASAVGLGLGRVIFALLSRSWEQRVQRLLAAVTRAAYEESDDAS